MKLQSPDKAADTETIRGRLQAVYKAEVGVREETGHNDGARVSAYLYYTGLASGHPWCAAFVSWCFGQVGYSQPRNPWSPALFPQARICWRLNGRNNQQPDTGDVFGIYGSKQRRIIHVGFVDAWGESWVHTVEGNSNNRVERRRRPVNSIYRVADWLRP